MNIFNTIKRILHRDMYATLDPEDGSITISKNLYHQMDKDAGGKLKNVYLFSMIGKHKFGWIINPMDNPQFKELNPPVADIQWNMKTNTIGFMPTCPTLAMMYYNWGLTEEKIRVTISRKKRNGLAIYTIEY